MAADVTQSSSSEGHVAKVTEEMLIRKQMLMEVLAGDANANV